MRSDVFKRKETKYILSKKQYEELLRIMDGKMAVDKYGKQTVNNIYFDNDNFELVSRSIDRPVYKEKLRMRVYGVPKDDSLAFFELKKKYQGIVYKRRINAPLEKIERYIHSGIPVEDSQIFREIDFVYRSKALEPKLYLAYDRVAYYGLDDEEFRMTFDTDIRYSFENTDVRCKNPVLLTGDDFVLMETKCQLVYPRWLIDFLNGNNLFKTSFSKYGTVYAKVLLENKEKKTCSA